MEPERGLAIERGRTGRARARWIGTRGEWIKRARDHRGGLTTTRAFHAREQAAKGKGGKNAKGKKK
jgi:hypothetical protein